MEAIELLLRVLDIAARLHQWPENIMRRHWLEKSMQKFHKPTATTGEKPGFISVPVTQFLLILFVFSSVFGGSSFAGGTLSDLDSAPAISKSGPVTLKVASFNIANGQGFENDSKNFVGTRHLKQCMELLKSLQLDAAGLQEVSKRRFSTGFVDQAKYLSKSLGMSVAWELAHSAGLFWILKQEQGNCVLTKHEIAGSERALFKATGTTGAGKQKRCAVISTLLVNGRKVTFISTHLGFPESARILQARELIGRIRTIEGPVILVGDFNTQEGSDSYKILTSLLADTWKLAGKTEKKVTIGTTAGIDHIFVTPSHFEVLETDVVNSGEAADHHLIWATLKLRGSEEPAF